MESISSKVRNFLLTKIEAQGYKIIDKASHNDLKKLCMTECNVKRGSADIVNEALKKIMKEKNIAIAEINPSKKIGDILLKVPTPEQPTTPASSTATTLTQPIIPQPPVPTITPMSSFQQSPVPTITTPDQKKILDPQVDKMNQETFKGCFDFIGQIYSSFGFIKGTGKIDYKDLTAEQFKTESDKLAERAGNFCYRRGIEIPMVVEAITILGTAFVIFGIPLITTLFMKTEKSELSESLKPDTKKVKM